MTETTDAVVLQFEAPTGETLSFEWHADVLEALDPAAVAERPAWQLGGELDWDEIETVRLVSARLGDGRLLTVAALRPAGAAGHGEEMVAGALGAAGEFEQLAGALLSTERPDAGPPRRIGLELHPSDGGMALRVAGDATASRSFAEGAVRRESTSFALRLAGEDGAGVLDVLTRAAA